MLNSTTPAISSMQKFVTQFWDDAIIPNLSEFIRIPAKSIDFDPDWQKHRYLHSALKLIANWAAQQNIAGLTTKVLEIKDLTPVLLIDIPGTLPKTLMFYGHADKMPESSGWDSGLDPWIPVIKGDRLYGRASTDDGYAAFATIAAIKALEQQNIPHPRCVIFLETSEESGSRDFAAYLEQYGEQLGNPAVIFILDAGGVDNERLWRVTSLRGHISAILTVQTLAKATHSGEAGGIVPSTFRVMRQLMQRIEDDATGVIRLHSLQLTLPSRVLAEADKLAAIVGNKVINQLPWHGDTQPLSSDIATLIINNTWRPALTVLGAEGFPPIPEAGNVLLPFIKLKLGLRLPPLTDAKAVIQELKEKLEIDPPYNATVTLEVPATPSLPWAEADGGNGLLAECFAAASKKYFGKEAATMGCGGAIGAVPTLNLKFPAAQIVLTGLFAPECGAHGPNEFLDIPAAKKFTCGLAEIISRL